jgi:hypothetical protein
MPADRNTERRRTRTIAGAVVSVATLCLAVWAVLATPAWAGGGDGSSTTTMTTTSEAGASTSTKTTTTASADTETSTKATTTAAASTSGSIYTARDAGSSCDENGHVIIHASIRNNSDTLSLTVTVTDITFAGHSDTAVVGPGETHTFFLDAGPGPLPGGQVSFHVVWDGGSADFVRGHSPTDCPAGTSTTQTASTTTPAGTSTTPTSTTSVPTTVSGSTVTPPSSSSTTPLGTTVAGRTVSPGGTAFTGFEDVVPLGTIALALMTGGSGLLWAGTRRRRHDDQDED